MDNLIFKKWWSFCFVTIIRLSQSGFYFGKRLEKKVMKFLKKNLFQKKSPKMTQKWLKMMIFIIFCQSPGSKFSPTTENPNYSKIKKNIKLIPSPLHIPGAK